jgi:hypothetical protein
LWGVKQRACLNRSIRTALVISWKRIAFVCILDLGFGIMLFHSCLSLLHDVQCII